MLNREEAEATVRHVVGLLAAGDYDGRARLSVGEGLSAADLRQSVEDYGRTVVAEPSDASEPSPLDDGAGWWTDIDLYTAEGGLSDLTLSLTLIDTPGALYGVRLDDLHVL